MADSFKTIAKPYNGKMNPCKVCGKTPNEGDEMWMQNLGDETNKKWIASPHEECFKKLQENPSIGQQQKKPFTVNKFPIGDAVKIYQLSEELLESFLKKREGKELSIGEQVVFIESIFRTLSGNFKP